MRGLTGRGGEAGDTHCRAFAAQRDQVITVCNRTRTDGHGSFTCGTGTVAQSDCAVSNRDIQITDGDRTRPRGGVVRAQGYRARAGGEIRITDRHRAIARGHVARTDRNRLAVNGPCA